MAKKLKWKAILIGVVVDLGASCIVGIVLSMLWLASATKHVQDAAAAAQQMSQDQTFLEISLAVGLFFVGLGGFVTAQVARSSIFANATVMAIISILIATPFSFKLPLWYNLVSFTMMVPTAIAGAWMASLGAAQRRRV